MRVASAYEVVDSQTSRVVEEFDSSEAAYRYADRRDEAYGAVRYTVRRNYEVMSAEEYAAFMARVRAEKVAA